MKILVELPVDRRREGRLTAYSDDGAPLCGPVRCLGEADDRAATAAGNPAEEPTQPFGDHPYGRSVVTGVEVGKQPTRSYGPAFLRLDPVDEIAAGGEARAGELAGRAGLGIHGGDLSASGALRPTFGCLRVDNAAAEELGALVSLTLRRGGVVAYECRRLEEDAP